LSDFIVHVGATINCPHGGQIAPITTNTRVLVQGSPVVTKPDTFLVSGCPFQVPIPGGTKPQPCMTAEFLVPALRVFVNGNPVILKNSTGICKSAEQIPQGTPNTIQTQIRVKGT